MKLPYLNTSFLFFVFLLYAPLSAAQQLQIKFAYVGSNSSDAYDGVQQGLKEANLQGQFLGQTYSVDVFNKVEELEDKTGSYIAILADVLAEDLRDLSQIAAQHAVFNLSAEDDELRRHCSPNLLHISASRQMKDDAVRQWQTKNPGANVMPQIWHEDFVKFAARDLNKRFRKTFSKAMQELAWAGWAAVKMTSDTVARENITDSIAMLKYLKSELAFDGQKGLSMTFRQTGQLRQLILLSENGKLLGEAPVRGVSKDIDSLGISACLK